MTYPAAPRPLLLAASAVAALSLASCAPAGPAPVGIDDVQTATVRIQPQGSFVEMGEELPVEQVFTGSGFILDPTGVVLTNNHVVTGAGTLDVFLEGEGDSIGATVLGASECLDLAVIQLEDGGSYPFLGWHQGEIAARDKVYSVGYPGGLGKEEFTITEGIVNKADTASETPWASLAHTVEHSARIRGGNSGGPLIDEMGRVVGINYAGSDETDYNFAISRDEVLDVLDDLKGGTPVLSLGLNVEAIPPSEEDGSPVGIWVTSVQAGGVADEAGIEPGDYITNMGGVTMGVDGTLEDYCDVIRTNGTEGVFEVSVVRYNEGSVYEGQINGDPLALVSQGTGGETPDETVYSFVDVYDNDADPHLVVTVPSAWTQLDGEPTVNDSGENIYHLKAAADLEGYDANWATPGVTVSASSAWTDLDIADVLGSWTSYAEGEECVPFDSGDYDDGAYVGSYAYYTGCRGAGDFRIVVATDYGATHLIEVTATLVSDEERGPVWDQIVSSFEAGGF